MSTVSPIPPASRAAKVLTSQRLDRLRRAARKVRDMAREIRAMPRQTVHLAGDQTGQNLQKAFTARHPRYLVIGSKTIGVALRPVPEDIPSFLRGRPKQVLRTNLNHAKTEGYTVREFTSTDRVDEILAINTSAEGRQGQKMAAKYTDPAIVAAYCRAHPNLIGVFLGDDLVAYLEPFISGEVVIIDRILGHRDHLATGVMYLLMLGFAEWAVARHAERPELKWLMYDMMLGAKPGLRYFKERLGFAPYRVTWVAG